VHTADILNLADRRVVERRSVPLLRHGMAVGRIFSFRDISREMEVQSGLRVAAQVFESSLDAIFIADAQGAVLQTNPACDGMLGAALSPGAQASALFAQTEPEWLDAVAQAWKEVGHWEGNRQLQRVDGSHCAVRLSWVVSRDERGQVQQSVGFIRDLTQQQAAQQKIEQLAFSDALTGLPNRLMLGQHVEQAITQDTQAEFAILFLDLDRFKIINDSLGHQFGDRVLQLVAQRLQSCLRPLDVLCRLGGDEFVLYLHACQKQHSERIARRIQDAMREPFVLDGLGFSVQCSIGMAQYPEHGRTLNELIKQADTAMYRVKASGKGSFGFTSRPCPTGCWAGCRWSMRCGRRWTVTPCAWSTSPRSKCTPAALSAARRCCAGRMHAWAWSRPGCSFRWPRSPATSSSSAPGCWSRRSRKPCAGSSRAWA
jgi:diguanylate cyclase (GGDEF)-like protein/PAS domain S-box-containing protein